MEYELSYQDNEFVVLACEERGIPIPIPELQAVPDILQGDEFYLSAFYELSTCRQIGFSMGPIPWREVIFFAEYAGLEPDLVPFFVRVMRALDSAFLKRQGKKKPSG